MYSSTVWNCVEPRRVYAGPPWPCRRTVNVYCVVCALGVEVDPSHEMGTPVGTLWTSLFEAVKVSASGSPAKN